jgi:hypothetical protein
MQAWGTCSSISSSSRRWQQHCRRRHSRSSGSARAWACRLLLPLPSWQWRVVLVTRMSRHMAAVRSSTMVRVCLVACKPLLPSCMESWSLTVCAAAVSLLHADRLPPHPPPPTAATNTPANGPTGDVTPVTPAGSYGGAGQQPLPQPPDCRYISERLAAQQQQQAGGVGSHPLQQQQQYGGQVAAAGSKQQAVQQQQQHPQQQQAHHSSAGGSSNGSTPLAEVADLYCLPYRHEQQQNGSSNGLLPQQQLQQQHGLMSPTTPHPTPEDSATTLAGRSPLVSNAGGCCLARPDALRTRQCCTGHASPATHITLTTLPADKLRANLQALGTPTAWPLWRCSRTQQQWPCCSTASSTSTSSRGHAAAAGAAYAAAAAGAAAPRMQTTSGSSSSTCHGLHAPAHLSG